MDAEAPISTQTLLEHTDWVRRLARSLVYDPDRAEDVVQETWRAALETPPRQTVDLRAWLAVVARNAARSLGRSESRRRVREGAVARPEAQPDVTDVLQRAQLQKRVTDALLELDEPYRSTLLLRHFEELKPAEIARRLGRPVNTVRTHLERGHARLRARLDEEFGGREAWGLALLPLARLPESAAGPAALVPSIGGWIVMLKWSLAAAVALLAGVALVPLVTSDAPLAPEEVAPEVAGEPAAAEAEPGGTDALDAGAASDDREALAAAEPADATSPAEGPSPTPVAGRVVDAKGVDRPGARLRLVDRDGSLRFSSAARAVPVAPQDPAEEVGAGRPGVDTPERRPGRLVRDTVELVAGANGRFAGELPFARWDVEAADEGWELLGQGRYVALDGVEETLFVVAPVAPVAGVVLGTDGQPAAGAKVSVDLTLDGIHGFPYALESAGAFRRWTLDPTGPDGRFREGRLPVVPGMILRARVEDEGSDWVYVGETEREVLELRLRAQPVRSEPFRVTGRVLDRDGLAVEGAALMFGQDQAVTDADGRFELSARYLMTDARLIATKEGFAPAFLEGLEPRLRDDRRAGEEVLLRLGAPTREIRGRVVDAGGRPRRDVDVYLVGGEGYGRSLFANAEDVVAGRRMAGVHTDADGRFVYDGLFGERYGLRALDPESFLCAEVTDVAPGGEEITLVLDEADSLPRLSGTVVDKGGAPVSGARLKLRFVTYRIPEGGYTSTSLDLGAADADGRFALEDVPHRHVELQVGGPGVDDTAFAIGPERAVGLRLVVPLVLRFQLDRARFDGLDGFHAVDAAGERVTLTEYRSGVVTYRDRARLGDAPSWPTFEVSDAAVELVFERDGAEVLRVPLELDRSAVTIVR